jgi:hypothetical protein
MVNCCVVPLQVNPAFTYCGVNEIVAVTGLLLVFVDVNAEISPVPFALNPMEGVLFTQEYDVAVPPKFTVAVDAPLQTTWSNGSFAIGVGLTVMVNV